MLVASRLHSRTLSALLLSVPIAIFAAGDAARAQMLTLVCKPEQPDPRGNWSLDVDLTNRTVTYLEGSPPRTVRAEVTDRFVTWSSPYGSGETIQRLDRRTGRLMGWISGHPTQVYLCERGQAPIQ